MAGLTQALSSLNSTFQQFFVGLAGAGQEIELSLVPEKTLSPGIGAYVGSHNDPVGEISALRIDAAASVRVEAGDADIASLVQNVTQAVMGVERAELQTAGIYRLKMREQEPLQTETGNRSSRVIHFSLLYEYLSLPTESENQINEIVLDIDLNPANGEVDVLLNTGFDADWDDSFDVVDDPDATQNPPSYWAFDAVEDGMHQTSAIRGGSLGLTARKSGTYLLVKPDVVEPLGDFLADVDFRSQDNDGIGFVFRYQDIDNFYFCLLSVRNGYAMLGKKFGGRFRFLDENGQANVAPYEIGALQKLKLVAIGQQFQVLVDGKLLVSGADTSIAAAGRIGLMCHGNNDVFFHRLQLLKLLGD